MTFSAVRRGEGEDGKFAAESPGRIRGLPSTSVSANAGYPPGENFTCDDARWPAEFYPSLIQRMPPFAGLTPVEGWAGLYEMTPDHNPIIGGHPDADGFLLANGFSGHGLMMAPATGKAIAELITTGTSRTFDISDFTFDRFRTGALLDDDATL